MASSRRSSPLGPPQGKRRRVETVNDLLHNEDANIGQDIHHNNAQDHARVHYGNVYGDVHHHSSLPLHQSQPHHGSGAIHGTHHLGKLLDSLRFEQMGHRHANIHSAYTSTCRWLLAHPQYVEWRDLDRASKHNGLLWIKGKPGAGKSTIMKFAYDDAVKGRHANTVVGFFFNARGSTALEKSIEGLYRSLLVQLLEKVPTIYPLLDVRHAVPSSWSVQALKDLFAAAVMQLEEARLVCFIDALDECCEDEVRDMVDFFEDLGEAAIAKQLSFRVCYSSRHYPHITTRKSLQLVLEAQAGHQNDMQKYIQTKLRIDGPDISKIKDELEKRASGVFLWTVLVVNILQKEYDRGRIHALRQRLLDIPSGLSDLFTSILAQDSTTDSATLLTLQLIMYAERPLRPGELYFAIISGTEPDAVDAVAGLVEDDMLQTSTLFILNCSKGLAELTGGPRPFVQFIHESVRDYLQETSLRMLDSSLNENMEGLSHDGIKRCCYDYITRRSVMARLASIIGKMQFSSPMNLSATQEVLPEVPIHEIYKALNLVDKIDRDLPFFKYATRGVLYHAEMSAKQGTAQDNFVHHFNWREWLYFDRIIHAPYGRKYKKWSVESLYILIREGMGHLLRARLRTYNTHSLNLAMWTPDEPYQSVLDAAIANDSPEALQALLEHDRGLLDNHIAHIIKTTVEKQRVDVLKMLLNTRDLSSQHRAQALMMAADSSSSALLECLIGANIHLGLGDQVLTEYLLIERPVPHPDFTHLARLFHEFSLDHPPVDFLAISLYIALLNLRSEITWMLLSVPGVEFHMMHVMALLPRDDLEGSIRASSLRVSVEGRIPVNATSRMIKMALRLLESRFVDRQIQKCLREIWSNDFEPAEYQRGSGAIDSRPGDFEHSEHSEDHEHPEDPENSKNSEHSEDHAVMGRLRINSDSSVLLFVTAITVTWDASCASLLQNYKMVELMLNKGISPDLDLPSGQTLLQVTCGDGNEKVAKLLLDRGANVNLRSSDGGCSTALSLACSNGQICIVRLLLEYSRDMGPQLSWPALLEVCRHGRSDILRLLLDLGLNLSDPGSPNWSRDIINAARENGHEGIVEILKEATRSRRVEPASELSSLRSGRNKPPFSG